MLVSVITRAFNRLEYTAPCVSNAKLCEIDGWNPVTQKYLQYEKCPPATFHESY